MSAHYQRFLRVLEKWPIDKTKSGRDLGVQIRTQIKKITDATTLTSEASTNIAAQIDALERLAGNIYGRKYPRIKQSTATGLSAEQCNQVLSSEFLQYLNDDKTQN